MISMQLQVDPEITLEQISAKHAEDLHSLVQKNWNQSLCYWCPDLKKTYASLDSTIAHIADANQKYAEDRSPDFIILYQGKVAGLISLSPIYDQGTKSEIGYWLGAEFEGRGLVSRSFPKVLEYAKHTLQLKAVELSTAATNVRSQVLPRQFGFERIGIRPNAEQLESGPVDHLVWRLML